MSYIIDPNPENTMQHDTWIIVPVYNEATVVKGVITQLSKTFKNIVCVDDASTDGTAKIVAQTTAVLLKHPIFWPASG